jgi:hypothetical protein
MPTAGATLSSAQRRSSGLVIRALLKWLMIATLPCLHRLHVISFTGIRASLCCAMLDCGRGNFSLNGLSVAGMSLLAGSALAAPLPAPGQAMNTNSKRERELHIGTRGRRLWSWPYGRFWSHGRVWPHGRTLQRDCTWRRSIGN